MVDFLHPDSLTVYCLGTEAEQICYPVTVTTSSSSSRVVRRSRRVSRGARCPAVFRCWFTDAVTQAWHAGRGGTALLARPGETGRTIPLTAQTQDQTSQRIYISTWICFMSNQTIRVSTKSYPIIPIPKMSERSWEPKKFENLKIQKLENLKT